MTNPNDPAFPQTIPVMDTSSGSVAYKIGEQFIPGLTKREYFAGLAMQGAITLKLPAKDAELMMPESVAKACVFLADALIKELNK